MQIRQRFVGWLLGKGGDLVYLTQCFVLLHFDYVDFCFDSRTSWFVATSDSKVVLSRKLKKRAAVKSASTRIREVLATATWSKNLQVRQPQEQQHQQQ